MSLNRVSGIRNGELRELAKKSSSSEMMPLLVKKSSRSRCFHLRYMELCRAKNWTPSPEIQKKSNDKTKLELFADKLAVNDWMMVIEALQHDIVLQSLVLRMRRSYPKSTIEPIDTESRARLFRQRPVVFTRFIFRCLVHSIANSVSTNKNLTVLKLEGLPLYNGYIESIANALGANENLETLSFRSSNIGDRGCEIICSTAKYLNRIAYVDLSDCNISAKGAAHVADMIKMQKISQFTEGWEKSLRYQDVDLSSISGLRTVMLANNPLIGDQGLRCITEVLKEDAWIRVIDMQCCGLTDFGAKLIQICLDWNTVIQEFNVKHNQGISPFMQRSIREQLGIPQFKRKEPEYDLTEFVSISKELQSLPKGQKFSLSFLLAHIKGLEHELSFERIVRKKAEKLTVKLSSQIMSEGQMSSEDFLETSLVTSHMPDECSEMQEHLIESPTYRQALFGKLINSAVPTPESTPRSDLSTMRNETQEQPYFSQLEEEQTEEESVESVESVEVSICEEEQEATPRLVTPIRKVRSEMKYVEKNVQDANKKNESKSDHEFANERYFNLKTTERFEQDIGDSVQVSANQQGQDHHEGGGDGSLTIRNDSEVKALRDAEQKNLNKNRQAGDNASNWNFNFSTLLASNHLERKSTQLSQSESEFFASYEKNMNEAREKMETLMGLRTPSVSSETSGSASASGSERDLKSFIKTRVDHRSKASFERRKCPVIDLNEMKLLSPHTAYMMLKKKNQEARSSRSSASEQ
ncbi:protein Cep78 homolog [Drosophila guanche]|uniref:Blast:Protein Cep78 homolog n=1 Tax=Drosophila guanche TaxID=7266 RepID=A0A3B0K3Z3_DROGU|nr:protein Cep78 homolog [Drosophila guanche]SPP80356.1 blast:Protein Cep78 homolog [Drosophila guanche]